MAKWTFEPGHTAAEFCVRHMMVTWVRGSFRDVHGTLDFDPANPLGSSVEIVIDADGLGSGETDRDAHLKGEDFLDVANHPKITYRGTTREVIGQNRFRVEGDLTLRGVTKPVDLDVTFLGRWNTPWWEDGEDKGPKLRSGFTASAEIDRTDFGVNWNGSLENEGVVVGNRVFITVDAEAVKDDT